MRTTASVWQPCGRGFYLEGIIFMISPKNGNVKGSSYDCAGGLRGAALPLRMHLVEARRLQRAVGRGREEQAPARRHEGGDSEPRRAGAADDLSTRRGARTLGAERVRARQRHAQERAVARGRRVGEDAPGGALLRAELPRHQGRGGRGTLPPLRRVSREGGRPLQEAPAEVGENFRRDPARGTRVGVRRGGAVHLRERAAPGARAARTGRRVVTPKDAPERSRVGVLGGGAEGGRGSLKSYGYFRPAASTLRVGSAPSHVASAVGPYVGGTPFPSRRR